jgi:hypothetical protein
VNRNSSTGWRLEGPLSLAQYRLEQLLAYLSQFDPTTIGLFAKLEQHAPLEHENKTSKWQEN